MRKIILVGKSEAGKTTLAQVMRGEQIKYQKTQCTNYLDVIIDTPGEYAQNKVLAGALALYSYEADIVGLLISATDDYSLYSPNITCLVNREVIGIVTQIDHKEGHPVCGVEWLKLAGCSKIFQVSAYTGEGITELLDYLES